MILKNDFPHCPTCKLGGRAWKPQSGDTAFQRNLKRFSETFNWFAQNVHPNTEVKRDVEKAPIWRMMVDNMRESENNIEYLDQQYKEDCFEFAREYDPNYEIPGLKFYQEEHFFW